MAFKLSLHKFKKVHSDEHHTLMRDARGNEIKVSHKPLSKELKGQLDALPVHMAQGGEVMKKENYKGTKKPKPMFAEGGRVLDKDQRERANKGEAPTDYGPNEQYTDAISKKPIPDDQLVRTWYGGKYAEGGPVTLNLQNGLPPAETGDLIEQPVPASEVPAEQPFSVGGMGPNMNAAPAQMPTQASNAFTPPPPADYPQIEQAALQSPALGVPPQASPQSQPQASQAPQQGTAPGLDIMDAYNTGMRGISDTAKAESAIAQEKLAAEQQNLKWSQDFDTTTKARMDASQKQLQEAATHFAEGKIDPNHLWANKSAVSKVSTILGLLLGGISGGAGQENPAIKMLNTQIDRDIEAQKAELGKRQTMVGFYQNQFHNLKDATDMAKLTHAAIFAQQAQIAAEKQGGALAKANADKLASELQAKYYPLKIQLDMRRAVSDFAKDPNGQAGTGRIDAMLNNLRVVNPEMAKEMEQRYVPGVGLGSVPVPAEARTGIIAKQQLNQQLQNMLQWSAKHEGSLDPKIANEGRALAAELQSAYRAGINGGVFKKGEQEFIDTIIDSDPTKFFNSMRVAPKLKAVIDTNSAQLNNLKQNYGLPTQAPPAQYAVKGGVKFVKVPGGWKKAQ